MRYIINRNFGPFLAGVLGASLVVIPVAIKGSGMSTRGGIDIVGQSDRIGTNGSGDTIIRDSAGATILTISSTGLTVATGKLLVADELNSNASADLTIHASTGQDTDFLDADGSTKVGEIQSGVDYVIATGGLNIPDNKSFSGGNGTWGWYTDNGNQRWNFYAASTEITHSYIDANNYVIAINAGVTGASGNTPLLLPQNLLLTGAGTMATPASGYLGMYPDTDDDTIKVVDQAGTHAAVTHAAIDLVP